MAAHQSMLSKPSIPYKKVALDLFVVVGAVNEHHVGFFVIFASQKLRRNDGSIAMIAFDDSDLPSNKVVGEI